MQWTGLNQLRDEFLRFFEGKGHLILPSAPLIPKDDNSLLLINSGMAPLKNFFTGAQTPPSKRIATCQKCIRTPDIERVGKTARHGTYFEMLGNFSFGDYFKREATAWAWEFVVKVLDLPVDRLWVTIYQDDDEAYDIWVNLVGVAPERIVRLGKADNFWEIGSGPCGPCSEIYFDRGEQYRCDSPTCGVGCDCDRYVEFWNLVFTQYDSDGNGNYTPLEHPNIDTGMGLERIACIMQGVENLFEVDTVARTMNRIGEIAGATYRKDAKTDVSLRVITDHIRSTTMMIGDGVVPSNEGRGYVLRRLLRRAARHGRLLGITKPFLFDVCSTVIDENKTAYPNLADNQDYIVRVIRMEEDRFLRTIDQGMELLTSLIDAIEAERTGEKPVLAGDLAFKLYDTFGFPIDLTREILEERNLGLDEDSFTRLMKEQRERARAARAGMGDLGWEDDALAGLDLSTCFVGYETAVCDAKVLAIVSGGSVVDALAQGEQAAILLDCTPFYAESGGQVGDTGILTDGRSVFEVTDCKKSPTGKTLHFGVQKEGTLLTNTHVKAAVEPKRRLSIMRNHTAAHLLQKALRDVLGNHVHQAGQLVDESACRFDFTHFSATTFEELARVEEAVNDMILSGMVVSILETSQEEARKKGAIALFSEKYGDTVRVVDMGGSAVELCGGTHLENTAGVGLFKILKESSVAAGVRRIEAVTGYGVLRHIHALEGILSSATEALKAGSPADLPARAAALTAELKDKDRRLDSLTQIMADAEMQSLFASARDVGGVRFFSAMLKGAKPDTLRSLGDRVREQSDAAAAVLVSAAEGKTSILAVASKAAVARGVNAGQLVRQLAALAGGSGGGRPDSAMGGTSAASLVEPAIAQAEKLLLEMIK